MALVNVVNMTVLENPTSFLNPFQFEITFECLTELEEDLEWKVLYVGSAHDADQDQVLDEILVGPVPVGLSKFVLSADAPNLDQLPATEVLGVTVVLVTCSYRSREFVRIGYYVNNEFVDPNAPPPPSLTEGTTNDAATSADDEDDDEDEDEIKDEMSDAKTPVALTPVPPPPPPLNIRDLDVKLIQRHVLADKPRMTKFPISWNPEPVVATGVTLPLSKSSTASENLVKNQETMLNGQMDVATTNIVN